MQVIWCFHLPFELSGDQWGHKMFLPLAFTLGRKCPQGFWTGWDPRQLGPERLQKLGKGNLNSNLNLCWPPDLSVLPSQMAWMWTGKRGPQQPGAILTSWHPETQWCRLATNCSGWGAGGKVTTAPELYMDRALAVAKWGMSHSGTRRAISNSNISVEVIWKPNYWFPAEA